MADDLVQGSTQVSVAANPIQPASVKPIDFSDAIKSARNLIAKTDDPSGQIVAELNAEMDATKAKLAAGELTPGGFKDVINASMLTKLAGSKIPPKNWGAITGLVNTRIDDLGASHYATVDKQQVVFDALGNMQVLTPAGTDEKVGWKESIELSLGSKAGGAIAYANTLKTDAEKQAYALRMINLSGAMLESNMVEGLAANKAKQVGRAAEVTKEQANTDLILQSTSQFNTQLVDALNAPSDDWQTDYNDFNQNMQTWMRGSSFPLLAAKAGMAPGVFEGKINAQIDQVKELFEIQSTEGKTSRAYKKAKLESDMRIENIKALLPDAALVAMEQPRFAEGMLRQAALLRSKNTDPTTLYALGVASAAHTQLLEAQFKAEDYTGALDQMGRYLQDVTKNPHNVPAAAMFSYWTRLEANKSRITNDEDREYLEGLQEKVKALMGSNQDFREAMQPSDVEK